MALNSSWSLLRVLSVLTLANFALFLSRFCTAARAAEEMPQRDLP